MVIDYSSPEPQQKKEKEKRKDNRPSIAYDSFSSFVRIWLLPPQIALLVLQI